MTLLCHVAFSGLFLSTLLLHLGCNPNNDSKKNNIIAMVDSLPVYESEVDSLLSKQIEEIKRETLQSMIEKRILSEEAKRRNMSIDSLLYTEVTKKSTEITSADFNRYIARYRINAKQKHAVDIIQQIKQLKKEEQRAEYIAYLKQKHTITISVFPKNIPIIKLDSIFYYNFNQQQKNNITVYIISDYTDKLCLYIEPKIQSIIKKHNNNVNFRYIYYNHAPGKAIAALNAASEQGKLVEMHTLIFENTENTKNEKNYSLFAEKLNMNVKKFKKDMGNSEITKKHTLNIKRLNKQGINSAPAFIVNNKLINATNSIDYLEAVIETEIQKTQPH